MKLLFVCAVLSLLFVLGMVYVIAAMIEDRCIICGDDFNLEDGRCAFCRLNMQYQDNDTVHR